MTDNGTTLVPTTYTALTTYTITDSSESSGSTTSTIPTVASQTSTTASDSYIFLRTITTTTEGVKWSTSTNSTGIQFFTQTTASTAFSTQTQSSSITFDSTTEIGSVSAYGLTATILQAESAELIYNLTPSSEWSGYKNAADDAYVTTRLTIVPMLSVCSMPSVTIQNGSQTLGNSSSSWSIPESTYLTNLRMSTYVTRTSVSVTNPAILPNGTAIVTGLFASAAQNVYTQTAWHSSSDSHEATGGTTGTRLAWASSLIDPGISYRGSLSWNVPRFTAFSTVFTIKEPIVVNTRSSSTGSFSVSTVYNYNTQSGEEYFSWSIDETVDKNTYFVRAPVCGTIQAGTTSADKFGPKAARLNSASGSWYSVDAQTTLQFATVMDGRSGLSTVMPTEFSNATFSGTRVTFKSGTTTTTAAVILAGASTTTVISDKPLSIWGGSPGLLETFANGVNAVGVYRDMVGGQTYSYLPGATTFSENRAIRKMESVRALCPPEGEGGFSETSLYWVVPRNSSGLPPVMPESVF